MLRAEGGHSSQEEPKVLEGDKCEGSEYSRAAAKRHCALVCGNTLLQGYAVLRTTHML